MVASDISEQLRSSACGLGSITTFSFGCNLMHFCLNSSARSRSMSETKSVSIPGKAAFRKRSISKLMTPQPSSPTAETSSSCRQRAARAALAAVRLALMIEPSMIASGRPLSVEFNTMTAEARSSPFSRFPGNEDTHLMPAAAKSPPR